MPGEFKGKVVVVSGGSRGIGRAIAMAFAREGAQTVLASSSQENLATAADAVAAQGSRPLTVAGDLRTLAACEQLFGRVNESFGRCDVLVNNAGATRAGNFLELADETWLDGFALKFFGAVRPVEPEFLMGGSVNAAAANFSKGLSRLGMRDGVHVNAIHPGQTATERTEQLVRQRAAAAGKSVEEVRGAMLEKSGTRRMATPEDIAELTLFLCSQRAGHIQGTAIAV